MLPLTNPLWSELPLRSCLISSGSHSHSTTRLTVAPRRARRRRLVRIDTELMASGDRPAAQVADMLSSQFFANAGPKVWHHEQLREVSKYRSLPEPQPPREDRPND